MPAEIIGLRRPPNSAFMSFVLTHLISTLVSGEKSFQPKADINQDGSDDLLDVDLLVGG